MGSAEHSCSFVFESGECSLAIRQETGRRGVCTTLLGGRGLQTRVKKSVSVTGKRKYKSLKNIILQWAEKRAIANDGI